MLMCRFATGFPVDAAADVGAIRRDGGAGV